MRSVWHAALAVVAVTLAGPARAQGGTDPALLDALAQVLAAEDARRWDGPVLEAAARHPAAVVRRHAALAMGRIGDSAATRTLIELLQDPELNVQRDAAVALGLLGDAAAIPALREAALTDVPEVGLMGGTVPVEAVTAIALIGGPSAAAVFEELLGAHVGNATAADVPLTVERAVAEAWRLGDAAPVNLLVEYSVSPVLSIKVGAVYSLMRLRTTAASDVLLGATENPEPDVRMYAVRALTAAYADSAALDRRALASRVRRLVGDPAPGVRVNALRSLATFGDSSVASTVVDRLTDQDLNVRVQAAATLADLGGSAAAGALREQVSRQPAALAREALIGLARLEQERSLDLVGRWVTHQDWPLRYAGAEALGYITADTVMPWLVYLTRDADGRVAAAALTSLIAIAPEMATRRARQLGLHDDPVVRAVAIDRLASAPDTSDIDLLLQAWAKARDDSIPDARIAIVTALARIADLSVAARVIIEDRFLGASPAPGDYLVRRAAHERWPAAAARWGPVYPIDTRKGLEDYRDIVQRTLLPAEAGVEPRLVIETSQGRVEVALYAAEAPLTVHALLQLVERRYFDAGRWHRVVPNFVIQDGDPRGDGWGGPGFALRDEVNHRRYETGTVGMALSGPDTGGSQFFITHGPQPHLNGTYPVVGHVVNGIDVVRLITQGDHIRRIRRP